MFVRERGHEWRQNAIVSNRFHGIQNGLPDGVWSFLNLPLQNVHILGVGKLRVPATAACTSFRSG